MRIPGVLQRLALCYLIAAGLYLHSGPKFRSAWVLFSLVGYWLLLKYVPVPGFGAGGLDYQGNLCGYIDTKLLAGHLYKPEFDPEGILSTIPAAATAILGTLAGDWLRRKGSRPGKLAGLLGSGVALLGVGLWLHPYFPINKQLWTSTFVLFTAGAALLLLAACHFLVDGLGWRKPAFPFLVFGTNAIVAYAGSILMFKLIALVQVSSAAGKMSLPRWIYERALMPWAGQLDGSLAYALLYVLLWLALVTPLYRKRMFIKI
jgi:predicted acyltransferase